MYRIGIGYDAHRLVENRKLILGGVDIPHTKGLLGHSDADVLLHAIIDAILGAAGEGDIGSLFPDSDDTYKNISSLLLLEKTVELIKDYSIVNIDATIIAQQPKLSPYLPQMRDNISKILNTSNINIKATTTEKMGFEGREEGISAQAVCLLMQHL